MTVIDRSVPLVYFGVEEGSKAHRMYNPKSNRIVVSRDVVFEESVKWSWEPAKNCSKFLITLNLTVFA